jgi:hypothetical protein
MRFFPANLMVQYSLEIRGGSADREIIDVVTIMRLQGVAQKYLGDMEGTTAPCNIFLVRPHRDIVEVMGGA